MMDVNFAGSVNNNPNNRKKKEKGTAPLVYKSISGAELSEFLERVGRCNGDVSFLKISRNVEYIRIRRTTLSYWKGKGTEMYQGTRKKVQEMDQLVTAHQKRKEKIAMMEHEPEQGDMGAQRERTRIYRHKSNVD